jgi:hypothetical protein
MHGSNLSRKMNFMFIAIIRKNFCVKNSEMLQELTENFKQPKL